MRALRFCTILCFFTVSCGLDSVTYLKYVDENNVVRTMNNHVEISDLPDGPGHPGVDKVALDFTSSRIPTVTSTDFPIFYANFIIFYRIYCSNTLLNSITEADLGTVNPTLLSDYNTLKPYTVTTNDYAASVGSAFSNRNYWSIDTSSTQYLLRSTQLITPYPENRYFINDSDLKNPSYLNSNNNADVVNNSSGVSYTYVSMYIAHTAIGTSLTPYYSSPTFLGVFLLPNLQ